MESLRFQNNLKTLLLAGVKAIYIESSEWYRLRRTIRSCCKNLDNPKPVWFWNKIDGFYSDDKSQESVSPQNNLPEDNNNPRKFPKMLEFLRSEDGKRHRVYVLEFADSQMSKIDLAEEFAITLQANALKGSHVIVLAPTLKDIPSFLKKEFVVLDFPLPERQDIKRLLEKTKANLGEACKHVDSNSNEVLDSVRGMGTTEILNTFAKIGIEKEKITMEEVPCMVAEKEQIIRKSGYLSFIPKSNEKNPIGGLGELREWLDSRELSLRQEARNAKISAPKGVLLLGIPGTGKSLCAKLVADTWKMPLLRLDMGSIFSGIVGSSEQNMRSAIKVAESLSPCVLWIDEIEKGLAGASNSGDVDGGTSLRILGYLLTWMQEKTKPVFVFATANDIGRLPPEFLRKGRFDEIFFVDLPSTSARKEIFRNHLRAKNQHIKEIDDSLLTETAGFSGSEIEGVVNEALFRAYVQDKKHPQITNDLLMSVAKGVFPLSRTMHERVQNLRELTKERFRPADKSEPPTIEPAKGPRLRSEKDDPFFDNQEDESAIDNQESES